MLATEATAILHGRETAEAAAETARRAFEEGAMAEGLPTFEIGRDKLEGGIPVTTLAQLSGLTSSSSEARRQIEGGGLRLNDLAVKDVKATVTMSDFTNGVIKLSIGRKKHMLVKPV
jgi:tyrosyl-tRNA synthetase